MSAFLFAELYREIVAMKVLEFKRDNCDLALAKSKRAHSLQHSRRHHPNQKPKAPSGGAGATEKEPGGTKKPSGKQVKEKPFQSWGQPALPSSWDRYEEKNDSGLEDPSGGGNQNQNWDVALPKSKGADYRHLSAEAQSQSHIYLDSFPSVDDFLAGEFSQAVGSVLSVKGEGILAWSGNDNFIVEEKSTGHPEAAFLSLNLHALAEQLEKIELAPRLFIEPDLLPPELVSKTSSSQECSQMLATNDLEVFRELSKELTFNEVSLSTFPGGAFVGPSLSIQGSSSGSQVVSDVTRAFRHELQSNVPHSVAQSSVDSFADLEGKHPQFEDVPAEAELDMLLDSFTKKKSLGSSGLSSADTLPVHKEASAALFQLPKTDPSSSMLSTANLDAGLDDLLMETSSLTSQNSLFQAQERTADHFVQSSPKTGTKSKALDDFDSWLDTL